MQVSGASPRGKALNRSQIENYTVDTNSPPEVELGGRDDA